LLTVHTTIRFVIAAQQLTLTVTLNMTWSWSEMGVNNC